jgi:hypothetical protein
MYLTFHEGMVQILGYLTLHEELKLNLIKMVFFIIYTRKYVRANTN